MSANEVRAWMCLILGWLAHNGGEKEMGVVFILIAVIAVVWDRWRVRAEKP